MIECTTSPPYTHETTQAFGPLAENLYLRLAKLADRDKLANLEAYPGQFDTRQAEDRYGIYDIIERLGDCLPNMSERAERLALQHFDRQYGALPTTLPRYAKYHEHSHHDHDGTPQHHGAPGCDSFHGPVQRFLESIEGKIGGRIAGRRTKAAAVIGMRCLMFCICPGDDIAALAAQALSGAGHSIERSTGEEYAVLPQRLRIVRRVDGEKVFGP